MRAHKCPNLPFQSMKAATCVTSPREGLALLVAQRLKLSSRGRRHRVSWISPGPSRGGTLGLSQARDFRGSDDGGPAAVEVVGRVVTGVRPSTLNARLRRDLPRDSRTPEVEDDAQKPRAQATSSIALGDHGSQDLPSLRGSGSSWNPTKPFFRGNSNPLLRAVSAPLSDGAIVPAPKPGVVASQSGSGRILKARNAESAQVALGAAVLGNAVANSVIAGALQSGLSRSAGSGPISGAHEPVVAHPQAGGPGGGGNTPDLPPILQITSSFPMTNPSPGQYVIETPVAVGTVMNIIALTPYQSQAGAIDSYGWQGGSSFSYYFNSPLSQPAPSGPTIPSGAQAFPTWVNTTAAFGTVPPQKGP